MSYYTIDPIAHTNACISFIKANEDTLPNFFNDERLIYDFVVESLTLLSKDGGFDDMIFDHLTARFLEYQSNVLVASIRKKNYSIQMQTFIANEVERLNTQWEALHIIKTRKLNYNQARIMVPDSAITAYYEMDPVLEFQFRFG